MPSGAKVNMKLIKELPGNGKSPVQAPQHNLLTGCNCTNSIIIQQDLVTSEQNQTPLKSRRNAEWGLTQIKETWKSGTVIRQNRNGSTI